MKKNKKEKCNFKCKTCHNYDKGKDFCKEKLIENCSKLVNGDFSKCDKYLINEKLVMF